MAPKHSRSTEDSQVDLGHVIFSALIALGFNPASIEQKERTPINPQMFKKMNQKVGDLILHFLFTQINPQKASEVFCDCWPIYDKKTEAHFRSAAFDWFKALNQSQHLNLKPVPVISKAVVTPTSHKFLPTLYTLSRFALHSQITNLDPSTLVISYPSLATKPNHRRMALHNILKSKLHHTSQYLTAIETRTKLLQLHRNKAKELVDKYRSLVKSRENVKHEIAEQLNTSLFIPPSVKERLHNAPLSQFSEELEQSLKSKNEDIAALWTSVSSLQQTDAQSWPKLSDILTGKKTLTTIDGEDYIPKENQNEHSVSGKIESCIKEGKLDLVSVFRCSADVFKTIRDYVKENCRPVEVEEARVAELKNRLKCVKALREDTEQIRETLDSFLSPLFVSVSELRQKLNGCFLLQTSSDSFSLCPPTPLLTLESGPRKSKLDFSYQLVNSHNSELSNRRRDHYSRETIASPFHLNLSYRNQQTSLLLPNQKQLQTNSSTSSALKHSSVCTSTSALDSGCDLSRGADSLLQSIEQLNITPKTRNSVALRRSPAFQGSSPSLCKSFINERDTSFSENFAAVEERKRLNFTPNSKSLGFLSATTIVEPNSSFKTAKKRSSISLERSRIDSSTNRSKGRDSRLSTTALCLSDLTQNDVDRRKDKFHSFSAVKMKHDTRLAPKRRSSHSPLVTKLLDDFKTEESSTAERNKFGNSEISTDVRRYTPQDSSLPRPFISSETSSRLDIPSYSHLTDRVLPSVVETKTFATKDNKSFQDFNIVGGQSSSQRQPEALSNLCASIASLESFLDELDETRPFDFALGNCTSKHILNSKEFMLSRESPDGSETFVDSRAFLDAETFSDQKLTCKDSISKFLPKDSLFDTLIESLVAGELESEILLNQDVDSDIRRESLTISRRDSVLSLGPRLSKVSPKYLGMLQSNKLGE